MLHRHTYNYSALHPTPYPQCTHPHKQLFLELPLFNVWTCLYVNVVFAGFQYIPRDVTRAGDNTPTGVTGLVVHVPHTPTQ